ncbi:uncharacterized protein LOC135827968 [Sycon ciliatum]|uniref:uncharacterized protein LOC135827968 n=1 Tax=Sycon ciliatum TaxID=27933 RepID=UPI0031F5F6B8
MNLLSKKWVQDMQDNTCFQEGIAHYRTQGVENIWVKKQKKNKFLTYNFTTKQVGRPQRQSNAYICGSKAPKEQICPGFKLVISTDMVTKDTAKSACIQHGMNLLLKNWALEMQKDACFQEGIAHYQTENIENIWVKKQNKNKILEYNTRRNTISSTQSSSNTYICASKITTCPVPSIVNGASQRDMVVFPGSAQYSCSPGYLLAGDARPKCTHDGQLSSVPSCTRVEFCNDTHIYLYRPTNEKMDYFSAERACAEQGAELPGDKAVRSCKNKKMLTSEGTVWLAGGKYKFWDACSSVQACTQKNNQPAHVLCQVKVQLFCQSSTTYLTAVGPLIESERNDHHKRSLCSSTKGQEWVGDSTHLENPDFQGCIRQLTALASRVPGLIDLVICTTTNQWQIDPMNRLVAFWAGPQNYEQARSTCLEHRMILPGISQGASLMKFVSQSLNGNHAWIEGLPSRLRLGTDMMPHDPRSTTFNTTICTMGE